VSQNPRALNQIYHPISKYHSVPLNSLTEALVKFGYSDIEHVPYQEWVSRLERDTTLKYGRAAPSLLQTDKGDRPKIASSNFEDKLGEISWEEYKITHGIFHEILSVDGGRGSYESSSV